MGSRLRVTRPGSPWALEVPCKREERNHGFGVLAFDAETNRIAGAIFENVDEATAAHIHGPAARGVAASVLVPMIAAGPGLWVLSDDATLSAANAEALACGLLYYNVHTEENPDGAIRGQLDLP